jgi:hypothetical protein
MTGSAHEPAVQRNFLYGWKVMKAVIPGPDFDQPAAPYSPPNFMLRQQEAWKQIETAIVSNKDWTRKCRSGKAEK